ncbi:Hypothetical protein D9617_13g099280 [Elsinoe fawcettii]|nr:Hypothetical protein D9617_13g099280 [Elsinoe fawcettii]
MSSQQETTAKHQPQQKYLFQLLHPRSAEGKFNFDYFFEVHLKKTNDVFKPAGLVQTLITRADATTEFLVVATFIFKDQARFQKALDSPAGQALFADVANFSPAQPTITSGSIVSEH